MPLTTWSLSFTNSHIPIMTFACEKVASYLGLDVGFHQALKFPAPLTTGLVMTLPQHGRMSINETSKSRSLTLMLLVANLANTKCYKKP